MKLLSAALLVILISQNASAASCKEKRKAIRTAHNTLKICNKAWQDSLRGDAADPSDDCTSAQAAYVAAVKEVKACHREAKTQAPTPTK